MFRARQERGGGPARRHAGIDQLNEMWTKPLSTKKEKERLSKYLADHRPAFTTRLPSVVSGDGSNQLPRRDQSLLNVMPKHAQGGGGGLTPKEERDRRRAQKAAIKAPTLEDMLREERENSLDRELRATTPSALVNQVRVSVGSVRGEVAMRMAKEKKKKEMEKRKKILNAVIKSEEVLALAMLKYEEQLIHVQHALEDAVDMHKTAALQTEQIHAFDPVSEFFYFFICFYLTAKKQSKANVP